MGNTGFDTHGKTARLPLWALTTCEKKSQEYMCVMGWCGTERCTRRQYIINYHANVDYCTSGMAACMWRGRDGVLQVTLILPTHAVESVWALRLSCFSVSSI